MVEKVQFDKEHVRIIVDVARVRFDTCYMDLGMDVGCGYLF